MGNFIVRKIFRFSIFLVIKFFSPSYDAIGGRRCEDLMGLVENAKCFTHVFVIVGDNDANTMPIQYICAKFKEFRDSVAPTVVKFAGNIRRKDLPGSLFPRTIISGIILVIS